LVLTHQRGAVGVDSSTTGWGACIWQVGELLAARELEIKMDAELQLMKLRGADDRSLDKALRRVGKHAEKVGNPMRAD
jgi:hypothetical protein